MGVIVMHRKSNYLSHLSTAQLPARGFIVLGMNPRCDNNEAAPWENNALDVRSGVNYLKNTVGVAANTMGGHYFSRDGEIFFDMAASPDKDYYVIEGATHGGTACTACTAVTGKSYSNATKNLFDLMRDWMNARY